MSRPRLLDLFCGAGGATRGYQQAGFHVTGVDISPQPHYCGDGFVQADALEVLAIITSGSFHEPIDAIHASPPCQHFAAMSNRHRGKGGLADQRPDLLTPTREILRQLTVPFVLENVLPARSAMQATLTLHGGMFGLGVYRPRLFESNVLIFAPPPSPPPVDAVGVYGKAHDGRLLWARADGSEQRAASSLAEAQEAMGMDWGDWHGVKEALPPAYTEYIGGQLMAHLRERAA